MYKRAGRGARVKVGEVVAVPVCSSSWRQFNLHAPVNGGELTWGRRWACRREGKEDAGEGSSRSIRGRRVLALRTGGRVEVGEVVAMPAVCEPQKQEKGAAGAWACPSAGGRVKVGEKAWPCQHDEEPQKREHEGKTS